MNLALKSIVLIFIFAFTPQLFGQRRPNSTEDGLIFASMDKVAGELRSESGAYSASIAVVKNGRSYIRNYGEIDKGKGNRATNKTHFEIASVTKTFAGTLMAKAVVEGKLRLDDDIRKYLKGAYPNLEYNGTPIRIRDLLTHKTGIFRRFPDTADLLKNFTDNTPFLLAKAEAAYSKQQFFKDLKTLKLDALPGSQFYYSELGPELSAVIVQNIYHKDFEALLREEIFKKAGMRSTKFHLGKNEVLANGYNVHNAVNIRMPRSESKLWGAAGFLKSTIGDLAKYIEYQLDVKNNVVAESHKALEEARKDAFWRGYFWDIHKDNDGNFTYYQHGGLFGTQNILFVVPKSNFGVSIIVNQSDNRTAEYLDKAMEQLATDLEAQ